MFIDKEWKQEANKVPASPQEIKQKNIIFYAIIVVLVLLGGFSAFLSFRSKPSSPTTETGQTNVTEETATTTSGFFPYGNGNGEEGQYALGTSTQNIKAEDLTFGHFFEKPKDDFQSSLVSYNLPINVKTDVANYYDVARKLNLDSAVDDFNDYGFALMSAPSQVANSDFFTTYKYLLEKEIPVAVTEDFLLYYYQNTLKQVFKEIEKNAFYENVWDINKHLYDISLARYKKSLEEEGMANDPILEGERLELAYFAVALKLLEPMKSQINQKVNFTDDTRFTMQEAENFSFDMPDYLADDVVKEVALIRAGNTISKSPVLLYQRNYKDFIVPKSYQINAKLNNFYLTLKWLNSVFPIFYIDENCPDCLLDRDDWVINMVAAANISQDFYSDQELKNQWAIIYKFLSFFSGLRSDLTYLNYYATFVNLFGENYNVRDIFSYENENRNQDIENIQKNLLTFKFSDLEGGIDRDDPAQKPYLGMRILQEDYWPNAYLLNQLAGGDMMGTGVLDGSINDTYCQPRNTEDYYRCNGFAYDILNAVYPLKNKSNYLQQNTDNYLMYEDRIGKLRKEIGRFDVYTWNNNIYWVTLDITRGLLTDDRADRPVFTRSEKWLQERDYNTFLAAWTNLHLNDDFFVSYYEAKDANLGVFTQCNQYNYVEPNVDLINNLIAHNNMLVKMLKMLEVTERTNTASVALKELNKKLDKILSIAKNELSNQPLSDEDCRFISDLIKQVLEEKGERQFVMRFPDNERFFRESIEGIKLLGLIYQKDNKKVLVIGPVFNFNEK